MILISKKRIQISMICLIIAVFTFSLQIANNKNTTKEDKNTLQTTSTPVSGKTVILDAGHGKPDEGAESSSRNNRSGNKFKNNFKSSKFIRTKWL